MPKPENKPQPSKQVPNKPPPQLPKQVPSKPNTPNHPGIIPQRRSLE